MGITDGMLLKRGNVWHWKHRLDGEVRWESLKVSSKRDAELIRQERITLYHSDRSNFSKSEPAKLEELYPPYRVKAIACGRRKQGSQTA
jgi:hypothetical protein